MEVEVIGHHMELYVNDKVQQIGTYPIPTTGVKSAGQIYIICINLRNSTQLSIKPS